MTDTNCASCIYWRKDRPNPATAIGQPSGGHCRRNPPGLVYFAIQTPQGMQMEVRGAYVPVSAEDWCGRFELKQNGRPDA